MKNPFLYIMGVISQMEREIKAERAAAGRAAAKARGKTIGRPRTDPDKLEPRKSNRVREYVSFRLLFLQ